LRTWGSQSWLQPPFEAAPRSTTEADLVVTKPETSLISKKGRLNFGSAVLSYILSGTPERLGEMK
jgi:hypothetical protein